MRNNIRQAFIFAAGKGIRFRPYSKSIPKPLFRVNGVPLVERLLDQINAAFPELDRIVVLTIDGDTMLRKALSTNAAIGKCDFLSVPDAYVTKGLIGGYAFLNGQIEPDEMFLSVLGDEFYGGGDHQRFAEFIATAKKLSGCCAIKKFKYPDEYLKNYSVEVDGDFEITCIREKPDTVSSEYFGLGLMAARGHLCSLACDAMQGSEKVEFFDLLHKLSKPSEPLGAFECKDIYVNINTPSDIYNCLRQIRETAQHTIDVIIPAWNEAETIQYVVKDFLPHCSSVIVMDNVSKDGTAVIAKAAGAKVYSEPLKGYGDAIKKGLDRSTADILVIVEADGTFHARDLPKLLAYLNDSDAVIGSRTYWHYIEYGANMDFIQRMMNILFGMIITALWWNRKSRFTDVGCSYRAIWRPVYASIQGNLRGTGPEFAPEFVIELLEKWHRVIEVPVPYHARALGVSKFSGSFFHLAKTALKMLRTILMRRLRSWFNNLRIVLSGIINVE